MTTICTTDRSLVWLLTLALVAVTCIGPSPAAARTLSDDELVDRVLAIYSPKPAGPHAPGSPSSDGPSGTSLIKAVERRWTELSKEHQKQLIPYLEEPVATGPGAPDGQKTLDTEHFTIIYQTVGTDAVPSPAYADQVAGYLEASWSKLIDEFGFAAPPGIATSKVRCHLKKINHNGLTHAATGKTAWIEINSDIAAYTRQILGTDADAIVADPAGLQAGMLKACCAHEFFHCIQASYDWNENNWWCEGTAEWAGDAVFPESKFYTANVRPRFENPHVSLFSEQSWYEYASSLWAFYLAENYGGAAIIKTVWEGCRGEGTVRQAVDEAVGGFEDQFTYFACYNYLRAYADGKRFPAMTALDVKGPTTVDSIGLERVPELYGANYFVVPVSGALHVKVTLGAGMRGNARLIAITGGRWKILPHTMTDGLLDVSLAADVGCDKLVVVICGLHDEGSLQFKLQLD